MIEEYNRNQLAKKEIQEARDEGLKEGEIKAAQAIAKNLLAAGLPIEQVAQATGLTVTDIQNNC